MINALKDQAAWQIKRTTEKNLALAQYRDDQKDGVIPEDQKFFQYVANGNTPGFVAADKQLEIVGSTIRGIQIEIGGPLAAQLSADRARIDKGFNVDNDFAG